MNVRSRSVFQNYENFQAWQEIPEQSHYNLLHKLNKNLSSYQNKYKKYMNIRQEQMKENHKFFQKNQQSIGQSIRHRQQIRQGESKQNKRQNIDIPFLPQIKYEPHAVVNSQDLRSKFQISDDKQLRDSEIFCERTNNYLKLKTISFDREKKRKNYVERRELSLHEAENVNKFFNQENTQIQPQKTKLQVVPSQLYRLSQSLQYKKLKNRLRKASSKSKECQAQNTRPEWAKSSLFLKKIKKISPLIKQIDKQNVQLKKTNEFSDKKFYEHKIKEKSKLGK